MCHVKSLCKEPDIFLYLDCHILHDNNHLFQESAAIIIFGCGKAHLNKLQNLCNVDIKQCYPIVDEDGSDLYTLDNSNTGN